MEAAVEGSSIKFADTLFQNLRSAKMCFTGLRQKRQLCVNQSESIRLP